MSSWMKVLLMVYLYWFVHTNFPSPTFPFNNSQITIKKNDFSVFHCNAFSATSGDDFSHRWFAYHWKDICTWLWLVLNKESFHPLKNLSSVIRYTLIHPNAIQRLNICGFNWKSSLTLNTAKFIEGKKSQ